ncbi:LPS translocon maturation chaperone LptM [Halomonas sp. GT]|nr:lipoprotein [Halomonas sp. GT]
MKRWVTTVSAVLLLALLLVGCGQKGPLYLPDENTNGSAAEQEG